MLSGERLSYEFASHNFQVFQTGTATGPLYGGNISIIQALLGTDSLSMPEGAVLMLEDVNEFMYAFDRSMVHLARSGLFEKASAIIFSDLKLRDGFSADNSLGLPLEAVLETHFSDFRGPIAFGLPCGHTERQMTMPIGSNVRLTVTDDRLNLAFEDFWDRSSDRALAA